MRDTAVYIGDTEDTLGTRLNKLNSAYHFGGVGEMINTINVIFDLDIQRFVMFDFGSAAEIIDLCHRCGVKPIVYMTWAEKRFPENQQKMIDTCEKLAADNHALLAPVGRFWQRVRMEHEDIDLFHSDGEHAGPYGDFLVAATLCKLICGALSPEVCGMGHDFLGALPLDFSRPLVLEDDSVRVRLDEEKCRRILKIIEMG